MNGIIRTLLIIFAALFAFALAMLLVMVDCGLEPNMCDNVSLFSKLPLSIVIALPIFLSAVIPSRYKKTSLTIRILSSLLMVFPLLAALKNSISYIFSTSSGFSDLLFGPALACIVFTMLVLLLWPEIKHLTSSSNGQNMLSPFLQKKAKKPPTNFTP